MASAKEAVIRHHLDLAVLPSNVDHHRSLPEVPLLVHLGPKLSTIKKPKLLVIECADEATVLWGVIAAYPCIGGPQHTCCFACYYTQNFLKKSCAPPKACVDVNLFAKLCSEIGVLVSACSLPGEC